MNIEKTKKDFNATIKNLEANIASFRKDGNKDAYRDVAGKLRMLFVDGKKSLLEKVLSEIKLNPLRGVYEPNEHTVLYIPGRLSFDGKGGGRLDNLFDEGVEISIKEWLEQPIFNIRITIKELIKSVADKESVHSDPEYNDTLKFTQTIKLVNDDLHPEYIIAIGEYILGKIGQE